MPLCVTLELPGRELRIRIWRASVGRVDLYLLDSDDPLNSPFDRGITAQLYGGDGEHRLLQEIVLGIGGWRALTALGIRPDVCHLNEGHAALATVERARAHVHANGTDFFTALWATRAGNVFTTHTPVAAAFDTFARPLLENYGPDYARSCGLTPEQLMGLGRVNPHDRDEPFNMAYLAARTCARMNGVSELHGRVSQRIFAPVYPRWPEAEVPVTHVTNAVHVPSWDSPWADGLWTEACGKERWLGNPERLTEAVSRLSDAQIWNFRAMERRDLVDYARRRLQRQLSQRGISTEIIAAARHALDPNVLTLGFARRFTEYKRPAMLLSQPERLMKLLTDTERPVQLIIAGKAHPRDEPGHAFVQRWAQFVQNDPVRLRAVFLEDYDMALAEQLVQGVDVWINTPRRPWEASGTSGMKVLANGGLNLSELDGWWAEAYSPDVGWALGDGREHLEPGWDAVETEQLFAYPRTRGCASFLRSGRGRHPARLGGAHPCEPREAHATLQQQSHAGRLSRATLPAGRRGALAAHRRARGECPLAVELVSRPSPELAGDPLGQCGTLGRARCLRHPRAGVPRRDPGRGRSRAGLRGRLERFAARMPRHAEGPRLERRGGRIRLRRAVAT